MKLRAHLNWVRGSVLFLPKIDRIHVKYDIHVNVTIAT
jgi:hypothetical protein